MFYKHRTFSESAKVRVRELTKFGANRRAVGMLNPCLSLKKVGSKEAPKNQKNPRKEISGGKPKPSVICWQEIIEHVLCAKFQDLDTAASTLGERGRNAGR